MKKKILLLAIFFISCLYVYNVSGYSVNESNNPGSGYTSGGSTVNGTAWINVGGQAGTQLQTVRIRIFRNGSVVSGMDKYFTLANSLTGCYSNISSVTHCKTSSYNYSSVTSKSGLTCNNNQTINFGCIYSSNLGKSWGYNNGVYSNGTYLDNYLKSSNYSNLKSVLSTMGYNENNFNREDIVIIEPATVVNCNNVKYFGTSTALMKKNVSYRGPSGNVCAGSTDSYNGYTFQNVFRKMSEALSQNGNVEIKNSGKYTNSKYTGFGFFKYKVSDFYVEYYLDLNGYLDGQIANNITGYGTADIYINGTKVKNDVNDYYKKWPKGTTYEIKNIKALTGKKYNGVYSGSLKGTITSDISVYLDYSTPGNLKINKVNSTHDKLAQLSSTTTPMFQLYTDSTCSTKKGDEFSATGGISNLDPGTYYLRETKTKKGYHLPQPGEKWYCEKITISSGDNEIEIENKTICETAFETGKYKPKNEEVSYSLSTMLGRIKLYNEILALGLNFNALLNLDNKTASSACKNIPITKSYNKGCLSANSTSTSSSNFSNENVSMYTEKYGTYTFCVTSYKMENKLGKSTFDDIKTGQSIISTDNVVAIGTINRECYNFGDNENVIPDLKSDNYIENDATIDGVDLIKTESLTGIKTNQALSTQYTLPIMYASNKDGKVYYGYCPSGEYCKVLGRGIVSKFNLKPGTYDLKFDIKLKKDKFGDLGPNSDCRYTVENELIDFNNKLSIEFRPVNTDSDALFLGKDGTSDRKIGANWSSKDDREFVLKEKNNSYNKNNEEPLYKITLTPEITKEIRKNNKNKTYDDYNMTCVEDGTICISNYLTCLQDRKILFIRERKNIDKFKVNQIVCKY